MTGIFRIWMMGHFMGPPGFRPETTPPNVESGDPTFQKMLWQVDETTGIAIESATRWVPELTEKRPGIIIKRNGFQRSKLVIGDKTIMAPDNSGNYYYVNAWQGAHTLFCIANKGAEVELLAAEVYREINQFSQLVRAQLDILRLEVRQVGDLMILEEARQNWTVPVVVSYAWTENWTLNNQSAVPVKTLDMAFMQP
jgi:hypothetical protein